MEGLCPDKLRLVPDGCVSETLLEKDHITKVTTVADLILNGDPEEYLKNVAGSHGLEI